MVALEFLHGVDECLNALDGLCVVAACAETSHRTVAFDSHHSLAGCELEERLLELCIFRIHDKADVHDGAVFFGHGTAEQFIAVNLSVEHFSPLAGSLVHCLYASLCLNPAKVLKSCINRYYGWCVKHGAFLYVRAIVKHCGNGTWCLTQCVVLHDDYGNAGHREVLLGTGIDAVVLGNVDRTAEDVRRHVANLPDRQIEVLAALGSVPVFR